MIETIEVLLKEYELNSIENNNSYTIRNRNAKMQVKRNAPEADESNIAEVEVMEKETEKVKESEDTEENTLSLFISSKSVTECLSNMALAKGEHIGRGHTAYLTFATKMK